ncbi:hypothetical protein JNW91_20085 [Micromonospora sp. STR1_7]|uniref:DUF4352 domain-containing protein n=1 Tax=Micromonospora parastrephiae TaxID=2806101 RepID=A0ABS1XXH2_9ACTN|nr:hypothetical protein [Micromonospora parastrephiae]MBM0233947.1 hypothetical protein [Micromonospora parastrephiae]
MNEDEVLNAMSKTLSDVRMDRPVEAIEKRGRSRRRNRGVLGAVAAGGGLAALAAIALALPIGSGPSGSAPAGGVTAPAMEPAAFSVVKQADGSVQLRLKSKQVINPEALEKALADAGVPAVVKAGVLCTPQGKELPQIEDVLTFERIEGVNEEGVSGDSEWVIAPAKMPKGSVLHFSVFPVRKGGDYAKVAWALVPKDAPMNCRSVAS